MRGIVYLFGLIVLLDGRFSLSREAFNVLFLLQKNEVKGAIFGNKLLMRERDLANHDGTAAYEQSSPGPQLEKRSREH